MTDIVSENGQRRVRIELIDILRALALLAMAAYHFTWDLDFHGFVPRGLATEGGWRLFARGIASTFLFTAGISLVLAHDRRIRWRSFAVREAQVVAGALAITLVTSFVTPDSFVFFGILHQIAAASLIGLLFLRLPALLTAAVGAAAIALPFFVSTTLTEPKGLAWIGLAVREPVTNDYVPILPWTGAVLLGIAAAVLSERLGVWRRVAALNAPLSTLRPLAVLGRHSLLFYLLHQPILFGLVAGYATVFPPDQTALFASSCRHECRATLDETACEAYCACVQTRLQADGLLGRLLKEATDDRENARIRRTVLQCSFSDEPAASP